LAESVADPVSLSVSQCPFFPHLFLLASASVTYDFLHPFPHRYIGRPRGICDKRKKCGKLALRTLGPPDSSIQRPPSLVPLLLNHSNSLSAFAQTSRYLRPKI